MHDVKVVEKIDKYEIHGEYRLINLRKKIDIYFGDELYTSKYERYSIGLFDDASGWDKFTRELVAAIHTDELRAKYLAENPPSEEEEGEDEQAGEDKKGKAKKNKMKADK